jgi:hypothetical protein
MGTDREDGPSGHMPDEFDRLLGVLDGVSTTSADTVVPVVPTMGVGGTRKFIIRTVRHAGKDYLFVEMIGRDRHFREVFPPEVTSVISRQARSLTEKNRRAGAKQAAVTRRQNPGYQPPVPPKRGGKK